MRTWIISIICLILGCTAVIGSGGAASALSPGDIAVVTPDSYSDCPSGYFCIWAGAGYQGTLVKYGVVGSYRSITLKNVGSYYNHRSSRSWLYQNGDGTGSSTCVNPGGKDSSLSGWQTSAGSVFLADRPTC